MAFGTFEKVCLALRTQWSRRSPNGKCHRGPQLCMDLTMLYGPIA